MSTTKWITSIKTKSSEPKPFRFPYERQVIGDGYNHRASINICNKTIRLRGSASANSVVEGDKAMKFKVLPLAIAVAALALAGCSDTDGEDIRLVPQDEQGPASDGSGQLDDGTSDGSAGAGSIVDVAQSAGNFNTLIAALQATGLDAALADPDSTWTVFAPTDDAFAALGEDTINGLLADTDTLSDILLYHVIADASVDAATAISLAGQTVEAANGDELAISLNGSALNINMSEVVAADVAASNGVIHVIDKVLLPPADPQPDAQLVSIYDTAAAAGSFNTLVAALDATGLSSTLSNEQDTFTVFAPTDAAFDALGADTINALLADTETLSSILLYHVIGGAAIDSTTALSLAGSNASMASGAETAISIRDGNLFINDSQVIQTDIAASNGVIHVIDAVLIPPSDDATGGDDGQGDQGEGGDTGSTNDDSPGTVLAVADAAGFTTLAAAVRAAGLDGALDHPGDIYTVFAPTDEAFAKLGSETINALLADPDTLRNILLYHVIPGTVVDSTTALGLVGFDIQAGNGESIKLSQQGDALLVNNATITAVDVPAVNGVIHVIDTVLIPPAR